MGCAEAVLPASWPRLASIISVWAAKSTNCWSVIGAPAAPFAAAAFPAPFFCAYAEMDVRDTQQTRTSNSFIGFPPGETIWMRRGMGQPQKLPRNGFETEFEGGQVSR